MDEDLAGMSHAQLIEEVQDPIPTVPDWPEFLRGCVRYRQSLDEQAPDAPRPSRPSLANLDAQNHELRPHVGEPGA
jgi:hypothetical protein